jgi:hypothetical protein
VYGRTVGVLLDAGDPSALLDDDVRRQIRDEHVQQLS